MRPNSLIFLLLFSLIISCAENRQVVADPGFKDIVRDLQVQPDQKNGPQSILWTDGSLKASGPVRNSKKNGTWKIFYKGTAGKSIMAEGGFFDDVLDGEWKEYSSDGKIKNKFIYRKGLLTSTMNFYDNGMARSEFYFKNGKVNGKSMEYYEDGKPREISWYEEGIKHGQTNIFYPNGNKKEIGRYTKDRKDGKWMLYNEEGRLESEGNYKDGKKTGKWIIYDEKGVKKEEKNYD